ncbi:chemotaxis protein CheX [bacterium]|nr:chemotaxis protein CheX [bacterium]
MADSKQDALIEAVDTALIGTLENMAFAEVVPLRKVPDCEFVDELNVYSVIDLIEPRAGRAVLILSKQLAESITESIYGMFEDGELGPDHQRDAVNEILNTLTGRLCVEMFGEDTIYNLGIPEFGMLAEKAEFQDPSSSWIQIDYSVEGWLLRVLIDTTLS